MTTISHVFPNAIFPASPTDAHGISPSIGADIQVVSGEGVPALAYGFLGIGGTSLLSAIMHVISLCSYPKMLWVKAWRIIANMQYGFTAKQRKPMPNERHYPMKANHSSPNVNASIPSGIVSAIPYPTA